MYSIRDAEGKFVGRSRRAESAHRRSRSGAGGSVNRVVSVGDPEWMAARAELVRKLGVLHRGDRVLIVSKPYHGVVSLVREAYRAIPPFEPGSQEQVEATEMAHEARIIDEGDGPLVHRPFRAPHHTVSEAGLVGTVRTSGGEKRERVGRRWVTKTTPIVYHRQPGEVSLATGGVLLLDEVLEFRGSALDAVAVALRDGVIVHTRGFSTGDPQQFDFPARPYAVVMTTTPEDFEKYGSNPRYARMMGFVTRKVVL